MKRRGTSGDMANDYQEVLKPNTYFDRTFNIDAAKILPGEYYATGREMIIVTVLGSCVSACIRDPVLGIGGMNHFMLPHNSSDGAAPVSTSARYGTYAMEILVNHLIKLGARRERFEAKLFGGGNVVKGFTVTNVGQRNARFAQEYMKMEGIKVVAQDLLDDCPRKVYYFARTGRVLVKKLRSVHNNTIVLREQEYESKLSHSTMGGEVELFG